MFKRINTLAVLPLLAAPLAAQQSPDEWLEKCRSRSGERHCEVREYTLSAPGNVLVLTASANGGIHVRAADRSDVRIVAKVEAHAQSRSAARDLAGEVKVVLGSGEVRSEGPRISGNQGWSVSYDVWAPGGTSVRMRTVNGGLSTDGIAGDIDAESTNGGIDLSGVRGAVSAHTTNGGVTIAVAGGDLGGIGIAARTTNGGIMLAIPENLGAELTAKAVNGGVTVGFPVQVSGRVGRTLQATLGSGGPPIQLETANGGITIRRP